MKTIKEAIQGINDWLQSEDAQRRDDIEEAIIEALSTPALDAAEMKIVIDRDFGVTNPFEVFVTPKNNNIISNPKLKPVKERILVLTPKKKRDTSKKRFGHNFGYKISSLEIADNSLLSENDALEDIVEKAFFCANGTDAYSLRVRINTLSSILEATAKMQKLGLSIDDVYGLYQALNAQKQLFTTNYQHSEATDEEILADVKGHAENIQKLCSANHYDCVALDKAVELFPANG